MQETQALQDKLNVLQQQNSNDVKFLKEMFEVSRKLSTSAGRVHEAGDAACPGRSA